MSLAELEARLRRELDEYAYPERDWVVPVAARDGERVFDVAIVGGGMAGLATAIGLRRERIGNVVVIDRNPAGREGPWATFARMLTLRTVKHLTGPDADLDSLTFRSWYEAQFGAAAYQRIDLIDKDDWMRYLVWLRAVMQVPVDNDTLVTAIEPENGLLRLRSTRQGRTLDYLARRVVLANGYEGQGAPRVLEFARRLPRRVWAHTSDAIDFRALRGARVGVLGGGASAFANSATALETGAREVVQCIRRARLPQVNWMRYAEFAGFFGGFPELDDARRLRFTRRMFDLPTPPPQDTLERVLHHTNFELRTDCGWTDATMVGERVEVATTRGPETFDFLILGTGYELDLALRPELAPVLPHIALWRDRHALAGTGVDAALGRFPYLDRGFGCMPKSAAAPPEIANLYILGPTALPSIGPICVGLNGMAYAIPRIVGALARSFFVEDADRYYAAFATFAEPESDIEQARARVRSG